jgi:lysophospholipase L1-like esterase
MKNILLSTLLLINALTLFANNNDTYYKASDKRFSFMGRGDFSNPDHPRFWTAAAQVTFSFKGTECTIDLTDEHLYNKNLNYIVLVVDGKYSRFKLPAAENKLSVGDNLKDTIHTVVLSKCTETNIGYIQFNGVNCRELLKQPTPPKRKIECFGNSITCGTGSDQSLVACGKGDWQDQHNAYLSYGALTARALNAQYHLTSISGIGLIHSCCDMDIVMPQVYDKISLRENKHSWNFALYQPDVVTICLGQNDGIQNKEKFCSAYVDFIKTLRKVYPRTRFVLLTSPMADEKLLPVLKDYLTTVVNSLHNSGKKKVSKFFFSRSYNSGCDAHPNLKEHELIAKELTDYLRQLMHWQ